MAATTGARSRMKRSMAKRQNVENLTTLVMLAILEVSVSTEVAYWMLGVIMAVTVAVREGSLILFFAEEVEEAVEREVGRLRAEFDGERPVPAIIPVQRLSDVRRE